MATKLTEEAEQRICDGLTRAVSMVAAGLSPNDAILKVAEEEKFPPGHVRLMCFAHNIGRANQQRTAASSLFDKVAKFELADPAAVVGKMYPREIKSAADQSREAGVSTSYASPPDWLKTKLAADRARLSTSLTASPQEPLAPLPARDPALFFRRVDGAAQKVARQREAYASELSNRRDQVADAIDAMGCELRKAGATSFDDFRDNAAMLYGAKAAVLLDKVAKDCGMPGPTVRDQRKMKVKTPYRMNRKLAEAVDRTRPPYSTVERILAAASQYAEVFAKAAAFEKEAVDRELRLARLASSQPAESLPADPSLPFVRRLKGEKLAYETIKRAFNPLVAGIELGVGAETGKSIMSKLAPKSDEKLKEESLDDVFDPSHEAKLRAIRSQAALHGILNGPYFEGEDPVKVTELFNSINRMSPRMADQPVALEAAMRRLAAQGSADPHDLDQILGIETKLKKRDEARPLPEDS